MAIYTSRALIKSCIAQTEVTTSFLHVISYMFLVRYQLITYLCNIDFSYHQTRTLSRLSEY